MYTLYLHIDGHVRLYPYLVMCEASNHEQNNEVIKSDGGAIGVTEDPSVLRRWMVAGPEISRLVANYETVQL